MWSWVKTRKKKDIQELYYYLISNNVSISTV